MTKPISEIIQIANVYMRENNGNLPILILAHRKNDPDIIIRGTFREKRFQQDQHTFISVMRLAMIVFKFTGYSFVMKPLIETAELEMTENVFVAGFVDKHTQYAEFFEVENNRLIPHSKGMELYGLMSQLLPSEAERTTTLDDKIQKSVRTYVKNCTYVLKEDKLDELPTPTDRTGLEALKQVYASTV